MGLSRAQILETHHAAIEIGLADSRVALLAGIDRAFVASIPVMGSPKEQFWIDLDYLSRIPVQDGYDHPLETWLHNALLLTAHDPGNEIFRRTLQELQNKLREKSASSSPQNALTELNGEGFRNSLQSPASPEQQKPRFGLHQLTLPMDGDPIRILLDYKMKDEPFARMLRRDLSPLIKVGKVTLWDPSEVPPGGHIEEHITYQLNIVHLFLPLLSASYLADDEAYQRLEFTLGHRKPEGLQVIAILARPFIGIETQFHTTRILPKHRRPISLYDNPDEAIAEIVHELSAVIDDIRQQKAQPHIPILPQTPFRPNATLPTPAAATSSPSAPPQPSPEAKPGTPIHLILRRNGPPKWNYIEPEGSSKISRELRNMGRGLVIEGPSKIGKTTVVLELLKDLQQKGKTAGESSFLDPTVPADMARLREILDTRRFSGHLVIDEAHRLSRNDLDNVAGLMRSLAEMDEPNAKLTLIGLRSLSRLLLSARKDLAGRFDAISLDRQPEANILALLERAEKAAGISFAHRSEIARQAMGSFYLAQVIAYRCAARVMDEVPERWTTIPNTPEAVQEDVICEISPPFEDAIHRFIRADRDTETPGACFALLYKAGNSLDGTAGLVDTRKRHPLLGPAFEWAENGALASLIDSDSELPGMVLFAKGRLSILDPVVLYYLRTMNWRADGHRAGLILEWIDDEPQIIVPRKPVKPIPGMPIHQEQLYPEHFLDQPAYPWWHPHAVELKDWLVRAYLKNGQTEMIANRAGIDLAYWDGAGTPERAWTSLLELAANQRKTRALLAQVLADKSKSAFHPHIEACIAPLDPPQP